MKLLIIAAMEKEIDLMINLLENINILSIENLKIYKGNIGNHEVYISKVGIGKVNSAINTLRLIEKLKPELLINSGVAGGAGIPVGSMLIAEKVAYHDVWCGPGTVYGQADNIPLYMEPDKKVLGLLDDLQDENILKGLICSGDKFISTSEEISFIKNKFPEVKAVDMESASIAQTCILLGIPFAIIRVVSDTPGEGENISQYKDFWKKAPEKTFSLLSEILKRLS